MASVAVDRHQCWDDAEALPIPSRRQPCRQRPSPTTSTPRPPASTPSSRRSGGWWSCWTNGAAIASSDASPERASTVPLRRAAERSRRTGRQRRSASMRMSDRRRTCRSTQASIGIAAVQTFRTCHADVIACRRDRTSSRDKCSRHRPSSAGLGDVDDHAGRACVAPDVVCHRQGRASCPVRCARMREPAYLAMFCVVDLRMRQGHRCQMPGFNEIDRSIWTS